VTTELTDFLTGSEQESRRVPWKAIFPRLELLALKEVNRKAFTEASDPQGCEEAREDVHSVVGAQDENRSDFKKDNYDRRDREPFAAVLGEQRSRAPPLGSSVPSRLKGNGLISNRVLDVLSATGS